MAKLKRENSIILLCARRKSHRIKRWVQNQTSHGMNNTCQQWNYWLNFVVQFDHMHVNSRLVYATAVCCCCCCCIPTIRPTKKSFTARPPFKMHTIFNAKHIFQHFIYVSLYFRWWFLSWGKCFATLSHGIVWIPFSTFYENNVDGKKNEIDFVL